MPMSARTLSYSLQQSLAGRRPAPVTVAPQPDPRSRRPRQIRHRRRCPIARSASPMINSPAVLRAAKPLAIGDRDAFLQDVATALQGQELGDGTVYRVVAQVQRRYYDPPTLGPEPRWGR